MTRFSKESKFQGIIIQNRRYYLDLYAGEPVANAEIIFREILRLSAVFRNVSAAFALEVGRVVCDFKISERQLVDYVSNVIREVHYPTITIGDIFRYRTKVKLYHYNERCDMITSHTVTSEDFFVKRVNGTKYYVLKRDVDYESQ